MCTLSSTGIPINCDPWQVVEVKGRGRGVKAVTPFKKGQYVCQYVGELIPYQEAKQREHRYTTSNAGSFMYYFWYKDKHLWLVSCTSLGYCTSAVQHYPI